MDDLTLMLSRVDITIDFELALTGFRLCLIYSCFQLCFRAGFGRFGGRRFGWLGLGFGLLPLLGGRYRCRFYNIILTLGQPLV